MKINLISNLYCLGAIASVIIAHGKLTIYCIAFLIIAFITSKQAFNIPPNKPL